MEYVIEISYPLDFSFSLDAAIEKLAPRQVTGSGAGCGYRDINFSYKTKASADKLLKRAKSFARKHKGVIVRHYSRKD